MNNQQPASGDSKPQQARPQVEADTAESSEVSGKTARSEFRAAQFDTRTARDEGASVASLGSLKRLQDPDKFGKARFRFRLYKR